MIWGDNSHSLCWMSLSEGLSILSIGELCVSNFSGLEGSKSPNDEKIVERLIFKELRWDPPPPTVSVIYLPNINVRECCKAMSYQLTANYSCVGEWVSLLEIFCIHTSQFQFELYLFKIIQNLYISAPMQIISLKSPTHIGLFSTSSLPLSCSSCESKRSTGGFPKFTFALPSSSWASSASATFSSITETDEQFFLCEIDQ